MKKLLKTVVCLTLSLVLCVGMSAMVFGAENASGEVSLDDILSLLSSLSTEEVGEEVEEEITAGTEDLQPVAETQSMGRVSFTLPENMEMMSDEGSEEVMYVNIPGFNTFLTMSLIENPGGLSIDLSNEEIQQSFIDTLVGEGAEVNHCALVTVDGQQALWVEVSVNILNQTAGSASIVVNLGDAIYVGGISSLESNDFMDTFVNYVNSIQIEGADGETDLSAALAGSSFSSGTPDVVSTTPDSVTAGATGDAIDATTVDQVVLLDDDLCTVTMKSFEIPEDTWYAMKIKVFIDNKTDKEIIVSADNTTLNGYVVNGFLYENVSAGHKSNTEMTFYADDLAESGIKDIRELSLRLEIEDAETYDTLETAEFTILPFGPDVPVQPEPEFGDDAMVLVDNDIFCMIVIGEPQQGDYYLELPVYVENRTDKNLDFYTYGSSAVNGYEISPSLYGTIPAGKKAITSLSWSNTDLEENDIEAIEEVELDLRACNADDWSEDDLFHEMVVFELN